MNRVLKKIRAGIRVVSVLAMICLLGGCANVNVQHYAAEKPALDLQRYFSGTLEGWGMFQKRSGEVARRFYVTIKCTWNGDVGTLDEDFVWSDGEKQKRVWTLRKVAPNRYIGTADDVVGEAIGEVAGNALNWKYTLALPVDGKTYHVQFDDWMYLIDNQVMLNQATMSKFGFTLGQVTLSFRPKN